MNAASLDVAPDHRHLTDAIATQAGNMEQLHVEAPALYRLKCAAIEGRLPPQALEPTLRVADTSNQEEACEEIEHAAHHIPEPGLTQALRAGHLARADGDIIRAKRRGAEAVELRRGHGKVGICHGHIL